MCRHMASLHRYDIDVHIRRTTEASRLLGDEEILTEQRAGEVGLAAHCRILRCSDEHANVSLNHIVTLPATCHVACTASA